jgi:hypothetical protein
MFHGGSIFPSGGGWDIQWERSPFQGLRRVFPAGVPVTQNAITGNKAVSSFSRQGVFRPLYLARSIFSYYIIPYSSSVFGIRKG